MSFSSVFPKKPTAWQSGVRSIAATVQGGEEAVAGGTGFATGVSLSATGEGALVGVPLAAVSAPVVVHGAATATEGAAHLGAATADAIKDAINKPAESRSSGPKAADAPGVSAGGQATDEHGNKRGPSGDTQVNRTRSNTREGANNRARNQGSRTTKHRNPRQGTLTSILLISRERRSLRVLTMNIPTKLPMADRSKRKRLWIGKVEVRAPKATDVLADAKGAFVNLVTWASDIDEFKSNAELVLGKLGLSIIDIENPEPVSIRRQKADFDDEIEDMVSRAEDNPNAIIYGTFHTWTRDDA